MKLDKKQGRIIISILSTITIILVLLVGTGYLDSSIGMFGGGILLIASGVVQKRVMEKPEKAIRSTEKYGASKWSIIVGGLMIILALVNMML